MQEYLGALLVQGYSPPNVTTYGKYIDKFIVHVDAEGKDLFTDDRKSPEAIDHGCLLRWMQAIRLTGVSEFSLQANKSAIGGWYRWLVRIGKVDRNPIEMLAAIKLPEIDPNPLPISEMLKILEAARKMDDAKFKERNVAIIETFYASGVRQAELRGIQIGDLVIDDERPHFKIRQGKGKRDGIGRLTPDAIEAIETWIPIRAKLLRRWERSPDVGPLFVSKTAGPLDQKSLWEMVRKIGWAVLKKEIYPHQFRHSFCTDLLNNGADLESIRKLARHKHLITTQKYLSVSTQHLDEAYRNHPRMKRRKDLEEPNG